MTWFYVDDNLAMHPKVLAAGNAAMGMWVRAGSWCMAGRKDGFVPDEAASLLGTRKQADRLVEVGLWERLPTGYAFHDWDVWQLTQRQRERRAEAGRKGGQTRVANLNARRIGGQANA